MMTSTTEEARPNFDGKEGKISLLKRVDWISESLIESLMRIGKPIYTTPPTSKYTQRMEHKSDSAKPNGNGTSEKSYLPQGGEISIYHVSPMNPETQHRDHIKKYR